MVTSKFDKPRVLTVDDDQSIHLALALELADEYELTSALCAQDTVEHLYRNAVDAVVLDIGMPDISGLDLLKILRQRYPTLPVVMLTGNSDPRSIVEAMKAGAADYVVKGATDLGTELRLRIEQAMERQKLIGKARALEEKVEEQQKDYEIVGTSAPVLKLKKQILALKGHGVSVLITGESGTGKELVARTLNIQEADRSRKIVCVNCAAIPENLAESELFGHEKGAFTSASRSQQGKFVAASGGDIFLDEIGELSLAVQSKLLRVLQERTVTPVGSNETISIDVRVIAATNRDLQEEVRAGRFREDLYYRISVMPLEIPPLRDRRGDIPMLVEHFMRQFGARSVRVTTEAMAQLQAHDWPGNIRALRNCLERAWITAQTDGQGTIRPEHLFYNDLGLGRGINQVIPVQFFPRRDTDLTPNHREQFMIHVEKLYFDAAYRASSQNKTHLAERLGLSRNFIHEKFKSLGLGGKDTEART